MISTILTALLTALLTTLCVTPSLLIFWLKTRLEKSIQNEYDKKIEEFRAGCQQIINKSNVSFSWWHNERANAMKNIYSLLAELEIALKHATPILTPDFSSMPNKEEAIKEYFQERYENLQSVYHGALHTWSNNKIFLDSDINHDIDVLINLCNNAVYRYKSALCRFGETCGTDDFDEACKSVGSFENLLEKIQERFRKLLQADPSKE